jgi:hypothetical protein
MISWMYLAVARMPLTGKLTATEYVTALLHVVTACLAFVLAKCSANPDICVHVFTCGSVTSL